MSTASPVSSCQPGTPRDANRQPDFDMPRGAKTARILPWKTSGGIYASSAASTEHQWWLWPNLLSLDAPLISVLWMQLFAVSARVHISPFVTLALALVVWLIYVADRLLDGLRADPQTLLSARHQFYRVHRKLWFTALLAVLALTCCVCLELNARMLELGTLLMLIVAGYFAVVHWICLRWRLRFPKEAVVALVFGVGIEPAPSSAPEQVIHKPLQRRKTADRQPRFLARHRRGHERALEAELGASFSRSACATGRNSPDSATSPNAHRVRGHRPLDSADTSAAATARSAAGSVIRAARDVEIDFGRREGEPAPCLQHREDHRQPPESQPTTARRGVAPRASRTVSACTSTSSGRVPSQRRRTPRYPSVARSCGQEQRRWIRHLAQAPAPHREHADLVHPAEAVLDRAQDAELVAATRPRNRAPYRPCARARAGRRCAPSLVTWPTRKTEVPVSLAKRVSSGAEARTWLTVPGALSHRVRVHRLDRIDHQQRRRPGRSYSVARCRGVEVAAASRPARHPAPAAARAAAAASSRRSGCLSPGGGLRW